LRATGFEGGAKPLGWSDIPRFPVRSHPDGVYFVDCKRGSGANTEYASGIAYYRNVRDGGNNGQQPDDYIDIVKGQNYPWEKSSSGESPSRHACCLTSIKKTSDDES